MAYHLTAARPPVTNLPVQFLHLLHYGHFPHHAVFLYPGGVHVTTGSILDTIPTILWPSNLVLLQIQVTAQNSLFPRFHLFGLARRTGVSIRMRLF